MRRTLIRAAALLVFVLVLVLLVVAMISTPDADAATRKKRATVSRAEFRSLAYADSYADVVRKFHGQRGRLQWRAPAGRISTVTRYGGDGVPTVDTGRRTDYRFYVGRVPYTGRNCWNVQVEFINDRLVNAENWSNICTRPGVNDGSQDPNERAGY